MPFQKMRQNHTSKNGANADLAAPQTTEHFLRLRRISRINPKAPWKRYYRTRLPMLVMVHKGTLIVRRGKDTHMGIPGDVVLLTPGTFALTAVPLATGDDVLLEYAKLPPSAFTELRAGGSLYEMAALREVPSRARGVYVQPNMVPKITRDWECMNDTRTILQQLLMTLMLSASPTMTPFLRAALYERRWAFLAMMEAHTLHPAPVEFLARRYGDGRAAFFRDCRRITDHTPAKWFLRRQMQLAQAWIHAANRTVAEVAKLLHYDDVRVFRAAYRKHFRRAPEDAEIVQLMGLDSLSLNDPSCCLRPFWWPYPLPLLGVSLRPSWPAEALPEPLEEEPQSSQACTEPDGEPQPEVSSELPADDPGEKEPEGKSVTERFCDAELIPITEIIEFPTGLPELLKAA